MSDTHSRADALTSQRSMRNLRIDGAEVTCHLYGTAHDGQDPIVLLHGIGGNTTLHFAFLLPMLARQHHVMAIDFGDPHLSENDPLKLEHLVNQACDAIDALLPDRNISLIGYSLGAEVAASIAAFHPAVKQLVLVAGWLQSSTCQQLFAAIWLRLATEGSQAIAAFARFASFGATYLNGNALFDVDQTTPIEPSRFTDAQVELATRIDLSRSAPRINAQTLVVGCSHDGMVDTDQSKALFGAIPHARYAEIDSGHAVVLERPAELLSLISSFISNPGQYLSGSILPTAMP